MSRKYRVAGYMFLLIVAALIGFFVGIDYGANKVTALNSLVAADISIHTIKYIQQNKLDKAVELQLSTLDTNIAIVDDIDKHSGNIVYYLYYPQRGISDWNMLRLDLDDQKQTLKDKYERLKTEARQPVSLTRPNGSVTTYTGKIRDKKLGTHPHLKN